MGKISDLPWGFTLLMDGGGGGVLPSPYIPKFSSRKSEFFREALPPTYHRRTGRQDLQWGEFNVISKSTP